MKILVAPVVLALCLACGGGGGSNTTSNPGNSTADAEGIYTGTLISTSVGNLSAYAVATPAGQLRYVASNADLASAQISTGAGTLYTPSGNTSLTLTKVTITPGTSAAGNYSLAAGDHGTFSFTYNSVYLRPVTLANLAGNYSSVQTTSGTEISITLDGSGNVSGGGFTGTVTQLDPTKNLYQVNLTYTSTGNTYSGLAFWADASATGLTPNAFYVQVSGVNNSLAIGAILTKNT